MKKAAGKKKSKRILGVILGGIFSCFALALLVVYLYLRPYIAEFEGYREKAKLIAASSSAADFKISESSFVYASDGSLISSVSGERKSYYLDYEDIPKAAIDCMLVTEDRDFYKHGGYDISAIAAAMYSYVKTGEIIRGGSTITQQLARNIYLSMDVTVERKATEIFLATELEAKYSKHKILEYYLNNIYFANGFYGIEAAAYGYFGSGSSELSLSQIAFLCSIPNNPTRYNPLENMENTLERRDKVLRQLYEYGGLEEDEYRAALLEKIELSPTDTKRQDYAETYSYYCAVRAIMAKNGFVFKNEFENEAEREEYDRQYHEMYSGILRSFYSGGYRIYTSINPELQKKLQESLDKGLEDFTDVNEAGIYKMQGSAVCIDNENGRTVAIIGGRSQETDGYTLNRAYQAFRQTGSATKPLIIYAPWFERGLSPDAMVLDEYFEGGPRNSGGYYYGNLTVREAVFVSANTIAWKYFNELTPEVGLSYLKAMNFSKIVANDYVPAASLGGFTYGASALEMASAYATLENDGVYRTPTCIVSICDSAGNTLVDGQSEQKRIYTVNAARTMTDILKDVLTKGTAWRLKLTNAVSAGKTGTASTQMDGWFAGYTKYFTTVVWVGCDYPKKIEGLTGNSYPGRIWHDFMEEIHIGLPIKDFPGYTDPAGLENPQENTHEASHYYPEFNAFGEPLDPETGLPYPKNAENEEAAEDEQNNADTSEAETGGSVSADEE